jgi:hypothetical protein
MYFLFTHVEMSFLPDPLGVFVVATPGQGFAALYLEEFSVRPVALTKCSAVLIAPKRNLNLASP